MHHQLTLRAQEQFLVLPTHRTVRLPTDRPSLELLHRRQVICQGRVLDTVQYACQASDLVPLKLFKIVGKSFDALKLAQLLRKRSARTLVYRRLLIVSHLYVTPH